MLPIPHTLQLSEQKVRPESFKVRTYSRNALLVPSPSIKSLWESSVEERDSRMKDSADPSGSPTLVSVGHQDAGHELLLAVGAEGVPNHHLILSQLPLQL